MLNYEFPPLGGGAAPVTHEIAKKLVGKGYEVDVVTMGYKGLPKEENVDGIKVYRVTSIRTKKESCSPPELLSYIISAKWFLRKLLKQKNYDICHCHFIIPTGAVARWVYKKFNIPYIVKSGGSDVPGYNTDRFKILHKFTAPFLRKICQDAKQLTVPSNYLHDLIKEKIGDYPIKIIPNGVYPEKFQPKQKKRTIVSTGRLLKRKGFQYLIKAVSEKDIGYEVHILGDGPMMEELKQLAEKSKTKIVLHGWVNNNSQEYKDVLESASICVLASEKENAPISLLEGMSAGCATITTNISGCPEVVGNTGLIVKPRSAEQLKEKIEYLTEDESRIQELGQRSRERVLQYYDWNKIINHYQKILNL
jgi:glycosyltransferase involved in cell wall biosynthesis